jgi:predicted acyltransferase
VLFKHYLNIIFKSSFMSEQNQTVVKKQRLLSIDALRGFDMFWILGAEGLFAALFILTGFSFFNVAAQQMLHSSWHGFTAYDLIFPLFIFLSGVSLGIAGKPMSSYSTEIQQQKIRHAFKRLLLLVVLGIFYNHGWGEGIPTSVDDIRFVSVLGRIGIAWFVAAMLVWYVSIRAQWLVAGGILLGYWLLLTFVELGGYGAGNYSATGSLNVWFDQNLLPGVIYQNLPLDPEGLLSNLTSIVNALIGVFVGRHMIAFQQQAGRLLRDLLIVGLALLAVGYLWGLVFPLNKTLWTSSFTLVTCGYSILLLTLFYAVIDVLKIQRWAGFFAVIGTNSIVVYLGTSIIDWKFTAKSLFGGIVDGAPLDWQPLLAVIALLLVQWLVLLWLYRRKIFIKV